MQLTQKEKELLKDLKGQEKLCVEKYSQHAAGETAPKNDFKQTYSVSETPEKKNDCYICSDLLATEKHASALYDTCIFEFKNEQLRTVLNSIQREEQEHGKKIYDYMAANNMYS